MRIKTLSKCLFPRFEMILNDIMFTNANLQKQNIVHSDYDRS